MNRGLLHGRVRRTLVALLAVTVMVAATGCSGTGNVDQGGDGAEPIPVGALNPVTGAGSAYGEGMQKAISIAAGEVNEAGGPLGRPLKVFYEDTATDPDQAVRGAQKLIDVNKVVAILGTWASASTLAVAPLTIEAGIIQMNASGSPDITTLDDNDLVFRTQASNTLYGEAFARAAWARGYRRAATMAINNPSGLGNVENFARQFQKMGGKVVASVVYNPDQTSYRSELEQVLAANPDVVVMGSYTPDATVILKEAYEMGAKAVFLGPAFAINRQLIDSLGPEPVEGVVAIDTVPDRESPTYERLARLYQEETGRDVFENPYAVQVYDMVHLLALAIERAGTTEGSAVAKALHEISGPPGKKVYSFAEGAELLRRGEDIDYEGASSAINFDAAGDVRPKFGVYEVHDGQLELVQVISLD